MAEAFAKMHGGKNLVAFSAGSKASGVVNPKAIASMKEVDYDLSKHKSQTIDEVGQGEFDYVVSMGCGDACPHVPTKNREDWQISDPKYMEPKEFNRIRDIIEAEVKYLIENL